MPNRLPLHDRHAAAGAAFRTVCDWKLPVAYGDPAAEHAAVRRDVGLVDRSHHGTLEVTGRDRATFLHAMLSNEIKALGPGQGCAAALLDVHGKVRVIVDVWVLEETIRLVTPPGMAAKTLEALDRHLFAEKAVLRDTTGELALLLLAGPGTPALVERITGAHLLDVARSHVAASIGGVGIRVGGGGGETGEAEAWIAASVADGGRVWDAAVAADARPVGATALESLRIEAGTPSFGHDVDEGTLLPEIPFAHLVSYTKGCYPGQEVVVRIRDRGHVNRMLVGLLVDGDTAPEGGADVVAAESLVGRVTSATHSLEFKRPIALAFVRSELARTGTGVGVRVGDRVVAATVSALPFRR